MSPFGLRLVTVNSSGVCTGCAQFNAMVPYFHATLRRRATFDCLSKWSSEWLPPLTDRLGPGAANRSLDILKAAFNQQGRSMGVPGRKFKSLPIHLA